MRHLVATKWGAVVTALVLALVAPAAPAFAAQPDGVIGPVIRHGGNWYLRTTPSGGAAEVGRYLAPVHRGESGGAS